MEPKKLEKPRKNGAFSTRQAVTKPDEETGGVFPTKKPSVIRKRNRPANKTPDPCQLAPQHKKRREKPKQAGFPRRLQTMRLCLLGKCLFHFGKKRDGISGSRTANGNRRSH